MNFNSIENIHYKDRTFYLPISNRLKNDEDLNNTSNIERTPKQIGFYLIRNHRHKTDRVA